MGPRHASRGVAQGSLASPSIALATLQWGHGTQAVVSEDGMFLVDDQIQLQWVHGTKAVVSGMAGEGERLPAVLQWVHGMKCVVSFTFGKTFGQLYGPLQWVHGMKAVVLAKRRHLYGRGTAASMGPRHESRGVDDARTNRTVVTEASMGPRHQSRGVGCRRDVPN